MSGGETPVIAERIKSIKKERPALLSLGDGGKHHGRCRERRVALQPRPRPEAGQHCLSLAIFLASLSSCPLGCPGDWQALAERNRTLLNWKNSEPLSRRTVSLCAGKNMTSNQASDTPTRDPFPLVYAESNRPRESADLRRLMAVPEDQRDVEWLKCMLQHAVRLEFTTIPPYLVAMWSVIDSGDPIVGLLSDIVHQEMLHMGTVCNLLNAIAGQPDISSPNTVPRYPTRLPGGVHPDLVIGLEPISKAVIANVFMEIEKPEFGPITWFRGESYPTIGAFYTAIEKRVARLTQAEIPGDRQLRLNKPDFKLQPIASVEDALCAIRLIKEQGEGTSSSPLFGPSLSDVAHYYTFGEIYHEKQLKQVPAGHWCYCGDDLPFPKPEGVYPMAPVPARGYPESRKFNETYTQMLSELQSACDKGGDAGGAHLATAMTLMSQLGPLAITLMTTEIPSSGGRRFGPSFHLV
jgi:hypothetical protein